MSWQEDKILLNLGKRNLVVVAQPVVNVVEAQPVITVVMAQAEPNATEDDVQLPAANTPKAPGKGQFKRRINKDEVYGLPKVNWGGEAKPVIPSGQYDGQKEYDAHSNTLPEATPTVKKKVLVRDTNTRKMVEKEIDAPERTLYRDRSHEQEVTNPNAVKPNEQGNVPVDENISVQNAIEIVELVHEYAASAEQFAMKSYQNMKGLMGDRNIYKMRRTSPQIVSIMKDLEFVEQAARRELQSFDRMIKILTVKDKIDSGDAKWPARKRKVPIGDNLSRVETDTPEEYQAKLDATAYDPDDQRPVDIVRRYRTIYTTIQKHMKNVISEATALNMRKLLDFEYVRYMAMLKKEMIRYWADWETNVAENPKDLDV